MLRPHALIRARRAALPAALAAVAVVVAVPGRSHASSLQDRIAAAQQHEHSLQSGIAADSRAIAGFQGRIGDLQGRLTALQSTLDAENAQLRRLQSELRSARARLMSLKLHLAQDRATLARELVSEYESAPPDLVTVVMDAKGFADLLERVDGLKRVQRANVQVTTRVRTARAQVAAQAKRLAALEAVKQRQAAAIMVQRDEVAQLKVALVDRELAFRRSRTRKSSELASLRSRRAVLQRQLARAQARAAAAQRAAYAAPTTTGGFSPGGGDDGFFPAPGTNYSVGQEPEIAARLDRLGKALHLHLIGLSGYRTPQHSVEVGGFTDDPHTRGEASDTPGVEGVPEATLEQFGLTRPFPGAAEADHVQLH